MQPYAIASCATFLFLPHFDAICDLLLDRCTATWNLFVNFTITAEIHVCSLAKFYGQYANRHMNLKFVRRVSERGRAIRPFVIHSYFDNVMTKFMINNRTDA